MSRLRCTLFSFLFLTFVLSHVATALFAQGLPAAAPESVGMSSERLDKLTAAMQAEVDQNRCCRKHRKQVEDTGLNRRAVALKRGQNNEGPEFRSLVAARMIIKGSA